MKRTARSVRDLPERIGSLKDRLERLTADDATASEHAGDPITIGKHPLAREDVAAVLARKLESLPLHVREPTRIPIGTYRGLTFGVIVNPNFPPDVYLEGAMTRLSGLSKEHQGPRAVLNALERLASSYGSEVVRIRQGAWWNFFKFHLPGGDGTADRPLHGREDLFSL